MSRQINHPAMITETNPLSPVSESYRILRTNLQFLLEEQSHQILSVTSAHPGEGKTTTIINLALSFAAEGKRVLLIDGDLRRSSIHHVFRLNNELGLSSVLSKRNDISEVIQSSHISNLDIIPSGPAPNRPSELLGSQELIDLFKRMKTHYDLILVDSPPLLVVSDAQIIVSRSDGVIMVVRAGKTRSQDAMKVKAYLEQIKANLLGVVLNHVKQKSQRQLYSYYSSHKKKRFHRL